MVLCLKERRVGAFPAVEGAGGYEETGFRRRGGNGSEDEFPHIARARKEQRTVESECPPGIHIDKADHFYLYGQQNAAAQEMEDPLIQHMSPDTVLRVSGIMEVLEADSFHVVPGWYFRPQGFCGIRLAYVASFHYSSKCHQGL